MAVGQRAECLEDGIAPALRPSKNIGPSLKLSGCRACWCHLQQVNYFCIFLEWFFCCSFWKALGEAAKAEEAAPHLCCSPFQEGEEWGGAGGDPTLWGTVGSSCFPPCDLFAASQGTWQSLSQRNLLACHLRICPTDAAARAGVRLKILPWSSSYFIMMLLTQALLSSCYSGNSLWEKLFWIHGTRFYLASCFAPQKIKLL